MHGVEVEVIFVTDSLTSDLYFLATFNNVETISNPTAFVLCCARRHLTRVVHRFDTTVFKLFLNRFEPIFLYSVETITLLKLFLNPFDSFFKHIFKIVFKR